MIQAGHPTSPEAVQPQPATYQVGAVQDHLACSLAQAEAHVRDNDVLFWDVRSPGEYSGADPRSNTPARAGHIPRAVNLEWTELVDPATGLFKRVCPAFYTLHLYQNCAIYEYL